MRFAFCLVLSAISLLAEDLKPAFPRADWERIDPAKAGFSSVRLDVLRAWLKTQKTTAMMVVVGGRVVFEYGDVRLTSKVASVRKSVLAMLYGKYVESGKVDLGSTVKDIELDDVQPFLPMEETATLQQLLTARSGIYIDSGNDSLTRFSPRRGSQFPGSYFQYQNWDFNAAGAAFEKLTGRDIYDALETDLAKPIEMQDWDKAKQRKIDVMPDSKFPEYAMYLSTRDMARIGLLMLRGGMWDEKPILPQGWAKRITTLVTRPEEIHPIGAGGTGLATRSAGRWGYGMLWWVWDAPKWPDIMTGPYDGAYTAMGANGQYITVLPADDMVIVHKVNIDRDETPEVTPEEFAAVLDMIIASECGDKCEAR